ncbi:LpqB family beta-propeller domain-containing protein [Planococcus sp. APC 4015]|nr:LpqB family beta-propeller domain-containing protein [Planococcus sp. APC 4015]
MSGPRRLTAALVASVLALLLTACAGLPTGGGVNEGLEPGSEIEAPDVSFIPDRPQPGATPEQVVDGFLRAGVGAADDWARAREFLAPAFRTVWMPSAGVTIDVQGTRVTRVLDDDTVSVLVSQVATVDAKGSYEDAAEGTTPLTFELAQQSDGEWRITEAPDGVVVDRNIFANVFNSYPLAYFDPSWRYLVPDVRWFPRSRAASLIASALVNSPSSDWLAGAVQSAFPDSVEVGLSVPVVAGVATVPLSSEALGADQETLDRMQTQLEASLGAVGVSEVEMLVGNTLLEADPVETQRTTVTGPPLVQIDQVFGFLAGGELTTVPGLSSRLADLDSVAVQVTADRSEAAVQLADGTVARVPADGGDVVTYDRTGLIAPTIDPWGVVWTVPRDAPHAVQGHLPDGRTVAVGEAWPEATQISAMAVSRDGTRIAALLTVGGRTVVWVSGIVRGADRAPSILGPPLDLGVATGVGRSITWLDDSTLGVLSAEGESTSMLEQLVGGPGIVTTGPAQAVSIAGGATIATMRVRSADGTLFVRRGSNWQEIASGIVLLATQQGMPE